MNRASKYNAKTQIIDGVKFGSTTEANRFCILKLMQKAGEISGLAPHPKFSLIVNGKLVGHFTADSSYFKRGEHFVEEVKGYRVRDYALRSKLFRALNPDIEFVEIGGKAKRASKPNWIQRRNLEKPRTTKGGHEG